MPSPGLVTAARRISSGSGCGGLACVAAFADLVQHRQLAEQGQAEQALSGALGRLMLVVEQYPDLKANQNMMQLTEELTSTENKVTFARQAFNDSVMGYNNALQVFPANMVAGMFGFTEAIFFEVEGLGDVGKAVVTADQKKDLDISFDDM